MIQTDYSTAATGEFLEHDHGHAEQGPPPKDAQEAFDRGLLDLPKGVVLVRTDDGFKMKYDRRSNNKWLGSENPPLSKLNYHGKPRR